MLSWVGIGVGGDQARLCQCRTINMRRKMDLLALSREVNQRATMSQVVNAAAVKTTVSLLIIITFPLFEAFEK